MLAAVPERISNSPLGDYPYLEKKDTYQDFSSNGLKFGKHTRTLPSVSPVARYLLSGLNSKHVYSGKDFSS